MTVDPLQIHAIDSDASDSEASELDDVEFNNAFIPSFDAEVLPELDTLQNASDDEEPIVMHTSADELSDSDSDSEKDEVEEQDTLKDKPVYAQPVEPNSTFFEIDSNKTYKSEFTALNLSRPLLKSIAKLGWTVPTQIQSRAIPLALQGRDICASAQTGSGKTAAFMVPVLERLLFRPRTRAASRVLVLVPTRELGSQVMDVTKALAEFSGVMISLCVGK
jgi:ATP-dependent RNA helicase DDX27